MQLCENDSRSRSNLDAMPFADIRNPMLASLQEPPVTQPGLVYEPKYDGIRAIVEIEAAPRRVVVYSRNGNDKTRQFPAIAGALKTLAARLPGPVVLDGEIVAVDHDNRPLGFQHIQGRIHRTSDGDIANAEHEQPAVLVLFDILRDGAEDLRGLPPRAGYGCRNASSRAGRTQTIGSARSPWTMAARCFAREAGGWEGLIVKSSQSISGNKRTPAWRSSRFSNSRSSWSVDGQAAAVTPALDRLVGFYDEAARCGGQGR